MYLACDFTMLGETGILESPWTGPARRGFVVMGYFEKVTLWGEGMC